MKKVIIFAFILLNAMQLNAQSQTYGGGNGTGEKPAHIKGVSYKMKRSYPGIIHNMDDIENMRRIVAEADPNSKAYQSFLNLKEMSFASADYQPHILTPEKCKGEANIISRFRSDDWIQQWEYDFYAMALNALMFAITEEQAHADKAAQLLNLYANRVVSTGTGESTPLGVGINMINYIYAADMIQSLAPKTFEKGEFKKICRWLVDVGVCPETENVFYKTPAYTNGNWGAVVLMSYMGLAVLLEDNDRYKKAINQYLYSEIFEDNGTLLHYIDDNGQSQEAGRDAAHAQLGLYGLNMVAEIAWKSGTDLYSAYDNRLMKGFEYLSKFNLGHDDVPFKTWQDVTEKRKYCYWTVISQMNRGDWRDVYDMPYNHYVNRMGYKMPYTQEVLETLTPMKYSNPNNRTTDATKYRPEKAIRQDDHFGFGSLLFLNDAN
ncbi:MAG: alginate lyase family protein [Rikenellaceae bacterium]